MGTVHIDFTWPLCLLGIGLLGGLLLRILSRWARARAIAQTHAVVEAYWTAQESETEKVSNGGDSPGQNENRA